MESDKEKEEYAKNISLGMSMHPQEKEIDNIEKSEHHSHFFDKAHTHMTCYHPKSKGMKPSCMAIKKRFTGGNPVVFTLSFYFCY
jgi:hypothetical protein